MSEQSSKDRTGLCTFIFENGRHCNMPQTGNELHLCYFHEKRELQRLMSREAGLKISRFLATNLHTACDLNAAFASLFRACVQGHIDSKTVNSLTRLGSLIVKTHLLAKDEYLSTYKNPWPEIVEKSAVFNMDPPIPQRQTVPVAEELPQEEVEWEDEPHVNEDAVSGVEEEAADHEEQDDEREEPEEESEGEEEEEQDEEEREEEEREEEHDKKDAESTVPVPVAKRSPQPHSSNPSSTRSEAQDSLRKISHLLERHLASRQSRSHNHPNPFKINTIPQFQS